MAFHRSLSFLLENDRKTSAKTCELDNESSYDDHSFGLEAHPILFRYVCFYFDIYFSSYGLS